MTWVRLDRRALLVGAACVFARSAWGGASTVLVLAERAPRHDVIVAAFRSACAGLDQIVYPLDDATDAAAFLADGIRDLPIDVVLAVGDRALRAAAREFTTVPVVYVDVTDASAGGLGGGGRRVDPGDTRRRIGPVGGGAPACAALRIGAVRARHRRRMVDRAGRGG
jgi:hypothetical protein